MSRTHRQLPFFLYDYYYYYFIIIIIITKSNELTIGPKLTKIQQTGISTKYYNRDTNSFVKLTESMIINNTTGTTNKKPFWQSRRQDSTGIGSLRTSYDHCATKLSEKANILNDHLNLFIQ